MNGKHWKTKLTFGIIRSSQIHKFCCWYLIVGAPPPKKRKKTPPYVKDSLPSVCDLVQ